MRRAANVLRGFLIATLVVALGLASAAWAHGAQYDPQSALSEPKDDQSDASQPSDPGAEESRGNEAAGQQDSDNSDTDSIKDQDSDDKNDLESSNQSSH
jgi:hypothetical protein